MSALGVADLSPARLRALLEAATGPAAPSELFYLAPALARRVVELEQALRACIEAHETGRFEPAQAAYHKARRAIAAEIKAMEGER